MKNYLKYVLVGMLALMLVTSPLSAFAQGNSGKDKGKSNGKNKTEKVEKMSNKESRERLQKMAREAREDSDDNDDDEDEDEDEDDEDKDDKKDKSSLKNASINSCVKAYGHLIAPGWIKKNGPINVDISNCWLPFGIGKKFRGGNASSTPDVTAPVISNIAFNPSRNQAEVRWNTNENANSVVFWNTTSSVDTSDTATNKITKNDLTKNHKVIVKGLTANTTYYVVVKSRDAAGNSTLSGVNSFKTQASSTDTQVPVISNVVTIIGTSTIQVGWKTNENTTDRVYYSTILPIVLNASTTSYVSNTTGTSTHLMTISGLSANTTYYLVIESTDTSGNVTTSATFSVHTGTVVVPPDVTAPVISSIVALPGSSTTTVSWTTNELSNSKVYYSTTSPLDMNASTTQTIVNSGLVTSHVISITGLATSTPYYFIVQSADSAGNTATSTEFTATTTIGI